MLIEKEEKPEPVFDTSNEFDNYQKEQMSEVVGNNDVKISRGMSLIIDLNE